MNRLHLEVRESVRDGKSRRLTRLTGDDGGKPVEIFHEFDRIVPFTADTPLDGHVLIVLLYAASLGRPLVVHGPVSRAAMRNIHELLLVWSRWKPERYARIDVIPERVVDLRPPPGPGATLAAFSGGADATFTALRHAPALGAAGDPTRYPLGALLMVHGFDVDLHNYDGFGRLLARVRPLVDALKLDLRTLRTNSRDLRLQDWDDSCGLELAGCLHMYAGEFQFGLRASGEPYEALVLPWGSSPVTDHLMSGDLFSIVHDGAGFSRTDKIAAFLDHPIACRTLKVCWAGADQSENCGRCEKCIRTRLNFLAAGATGRPACFPDDLNLDHLRAVPISNGIQAGEMRGLLAHAARNNVSGPWMAVLEERLAAWRPTDAAVLEREKKGGAVKRALVRMVSRLGLEAPAKRVWRPARRAVLGALNRKSVVTKW